MYAGKIVKKPNVERISLERRVGLHERCLGAPTSSSAFSNIIADEDVGAPTWLNFRTGNAVEMAPLYR